MSENIKPKKSKKAIVQKTQPDFVEHQVRFEPKRFNALVFDKGYDVFIDRAFRCPCAVKGAGQPLPKCLNCLGVGWVFTNRIETRIAVQGQKADVKYENWSRTTTGMARITARAADKLAFMDRIILRDVEGYYNEILRSFDKFDKETQTTKKYFFTNYPLIVIEDLMIFLNTDTKLRHLEENVDYILDLENYETRIELIDTGLVGELTATIRYRHYQTYHVIDMNRDITKVREKGCVQPEEDLKEMPVAGMARKAHYLFDNLKYIESDKLLDNTDEDTD